MSNGGCERYSEAAGPPNTAGMLNPMYMMQSAVKSNGGESCSEGDHQYSLLTRHQVPSPSHDCQPSNGAYGHCEQQLRSS